MKIYIISNVEYPFENKLQVQPDDLLVFLNTAKSYIYYLEHKNKIVFHRSKEMSYRCTVPTLNNKYVFGPNRDIPDSFIKDLKKSYNWDYQIQQGKVKCATTGYMVVKWIEHCYPDNEIYLVNFGYKVSKSSYRCPYHNWLFENKELQKYKHIYTAKTVSDSNSLKIFFETLGWLRRFISSWCSCRKSCRCWS